MEELVPIALFAIASSDLIRDDFEIRNALRDYTAVVLSRAETSTFPCLPVLMAASAIGGCLALSQMPSLWVLLNEMDIPTTSPLALTVLGLFGFVGWAALDRGWSEPV